MPSIQLATVERLLKGLGVESKKFEFYSDFAALIGVDLYGYLDNSAFVLAERVFSEHYFSPEEITTVASCSTAMGMFSPEVDRDMLRFFSPVAERFLDQCAEEVANCPIDTVCFSLTTVQTAASMALAKRLALLRPDVTIVFGGTSCAGEMGRAIAEICNEVDIVVHGEAEISLPPLVAALVRGSLDDVPGITFRNGKELVSTRRAGIAEMKRDPAPLNFDSYFERGDRNGLFSTVSPWIPFEGSRGCWYGEKVQCTFCGLNEIIRFRTGGSSGLVEELRGYVERYHSRQLFAVDLIIPRDFLKSFFPEARRQAVDWHMFYEVKSNMSREELEVLSGGGVRWVQPGIESLDDSVLRLMKKGVSAAQNIVFLRDCVDLSMQVNWNLLAGFPGEDTESYDRMISMMPLLYHLPPPTGLGKFEVHRFSPYFERPADFGIVICGPDQRYRQAFPVPEDVLRRLVYRFDFKTTKDFHERDVQEKQIEKLGRAASEWRKRWASGASLRWSLVSDGSSIVIDNRRSEHRTIKLSQSESALLAFLSVRRPTVSSYEMFRTRHLGTSTELDDIDSFRDTIGRLVHFGLVIELSGYLFHVLNEMKPAHATQTEEVHHEQPV